MVRIIKAIFGGTFLLIAIGCLVRLAVLLMGRADQAATRSGTQSAAALGALQWTFFLILSGGAAIFFLYSAFRRPKLMTPVNPPL